MKIDFKGMVNALELLSQAIKSLYNNHIYKKIQEIKSDGQLTYDKVEWLFMEEGFIKPEAAVSAILAIKAKLPELNYIQIIIKSNHPTRDKLVLLCGYIEPFIYKQAEITPSRDIKTDFERVVNKTSKINLDDYQLLMIYMLVEIIFKNFKKEEFTPDRRLPHRNCILHDGLISYSDQEVETAYYTLVCYIYDLRLF